MTSRDLHDSKGRSCLDHARVKFGVRPRAEAPFKAAYEASASLVSASYLTQNRPDCAPE